MLEKWNEIPKELVLGWPRSVLLGDEKLIVEQHQGIYACTQEEIVLRTQCGLMVDHRGKPVPVPLRSGRAGGVGQDREALLPAKGVKE